MKKRITIIYMAIYKIGLSRLVKHLQISMTDHSVIAKKWKLFHRQILDENKRSLEKNDSMHYMLALTDQSFKPFTVCNN